MLKKYVVLYNSTNIGWIAYSTTGSKAKRFSKENISRVFFIFECDPRQLYPFTMKLKYPFPPYYRAGKINKYREEAFSEEEEYLIVREDEGDYFDVQVVNFSI